MRQVKGSNFGPETLTESFRGFTQSCQTTVVIVTEAGISLLPSTSFPIHYSLIIPPFDAIAYRLMSATDRIVQ
jgi:hypothetical protein